MDLFPTLAKISNSKIPTGIKIDGIDISEFLLDPDAKTLAERPFYFYARNGELEAIRLGEWKLHLKKSIGWNEKSEGEFQAALYNLNLDIGEKDNVATHHPEIVTKLSELATAFDAKL